MQMKCYPWTPALISCCGHWSTSLALLAAWFPCLLHETRYLLWVLWPPHAKIWLIGKDSDAGKDWGQEEKGTTEDEMAGWRHWLDGRESEWTSGDGDGQGGLVCCDSWGLKESDPTERLNWTEERRTRVKDNRLARCWGAFAVQNVCCLGFLLVKKSLSEYFYLVQFSHVQLFATRGLQHARPPCPSPTPGVHWDSWPSSWWCHPAISSSVVPFSSCPRLCPASGSLPVSQFFASGGKVLEFSALASVLPVDIQDWSSE